MNMLWYEKFLYAATGQHFPRFSSKESLLEDLISYSICIRYPIYNLRSSFLLGSFKDFWVYYHFFFPENMTQHYFQGAPCWHCSYSCVDWRIEGKAQWYCSQSEDWISSQSPSMKKEIWLNPSSMEGLCSII